MEIPMHTIISIFGQDRIDLLQGLITTNIKSNKGHMTCFCNGKGRVIADAYIINKHDHTLIISRSDVTSIIITHVKKYQVIADISIELKECKTTLKPFNDASISFKYPLGPELFLTPTNKTNKSTDDLYNTEHFVMINPLISSQHLPQSLGYDTFGMIDLKKGCFLGQEVITRLTRRGTLKHKLFQIENFKCSVGDTIFHNEKPIGSIVQQNTHTYAILSHNTLSARHPIGEVKIIQCMLP